jgi:hypothetical protein
VDDAVLLVDGEANILTALARLFLDRDVRVLRAETGPKSGGWSRSAPTTPWTAGTISAACTG